MSLHDRIMELDHGYDGACFAFNDGYGEAKKDAAKIAKEADELMAEMAEALHIYADQDFGYGVAVDALKQYYAWKD